MHNPFTIPPEKEREIRAMLESATQEWHAVKRVMEILAGTCNDFVIDHWCRWAKKQVAENVARERHVKKYW